MQRVARLMYEVEVFTRFAGLGKKLAPVDVIQARYSAKRSGVGVEKENLKTTHLQFFQFWHSPRNTFLLARNLLLGLGLVANSSPPLAFVRPPLRCGVPASSSHRDHDGRFIALTGPESGGLITAFLHGRVVNSKADVLKLHKHFESSHCGNLKRCRLNARQTGAHAWLQKYILETWSIGTSLYLFGIQDSRIRKSSVVPIL